MSTTAAVSSIAHHADGVTATVTTMLQPAVTILSDDGAMGDSAG